MAALPEGDLMGTWHFIGLPSSSWDGGTTGTGDLSSILLCEMVGAALGNIPGISPRDRGTTETGDLSLFYVAKFSVRPWEESPGICPWDGGTTGTGKFCLNRVTVDIYR